MIQRYVMGRLHHTTAFCRKVKQPRRHKGVARQSRNQNPSRELRESSVAAVYDRRRCRAHGSPAVIDRRYSRFRVIRGQQTCPKNKKLRICYTKTQRKARSEERRVGKESNTRRRRYHKKKKTK